MKKQILSTVFALNLGLILPASAETVFAAEPPLSSVELTSFDGAVNTPSPVSGSSIVATGSSIEVITPTHSSPSKNSNTQNYSQYGTTVKSYLYENEDGGITRVEFLTDKVIVENYDSEFQIQFSGQLKMELPKFGGFFSGKDYNFLVFGQDNPEESNETEVLRIVKYTKDWERIESTSICGANTREPFYVGSLRIAEDENTLYIRTSHKMFKSYDGKNHQANFTISINIPDMTVIGQASGIGSGGGYVSHSFNQFITTDGSVLLTADHGDAYPRAIVIAQYANKNAGSFAVGHYSASSVRVLPIKGGLANPNTGVSLGGLVISNQSYLTAGNSISEDETNLNATRNIFVTSTPKDDFSKTQTYWLTNYSSSDKVSVSTPQMVKINEDCILVLYTIDGQINYVYLNGEGKVISKTYTMEGNLSDCVPIFYNNEVLWYYTDNSTPVFCSINPDDADFINPINPPNKDDNSNSDDDDDDSGSSYFTSDPSYKGKETLNSSEQETVANAVRTVLGTNATIASIEKIDTGICIISTSGDVIFSKTNGNLAINEWEKVGTDWYYFDADKKAAKGWKYLGDKWYYLDDTSSKMVTGWKKTATQNWFYLDPQNGDMKTGWQFVNNQWYYLDPTNGDMKIDWQFINNKWYYLDRTNGNMKTGWLKWNNNWYYMDTKNGDCLINTITPDGYTTDENGAWIP